MSGIPIICCHIGPAWYLPYVLAQARTWNPSSQVYLLGNHQQQDYPYVHCVNVTDYSKDSLKFAQVYEHFNLNKVEFELICIQRWLAIREFVNHAGLERVFVIDSDVLLFCDVSKEYRKYSQFEFTLNQGMAAGDSYFTRTALNALADWILDLYTKKQGFIWDLLVKESELIMKHEKQGGISDMYLLRQFALSRPWEVGESMTIIEGACFDHNFNSCTPDFKMIYGVKHIEWKDKCIPTCWCNRTKQHVRLLDLHFQGNSKQNIPDFFTESTHSFTKHTAKIDG